MPRDSAGTYTRTNGVFSGSTTWDQQAASADKFINSGRHDTHDEDIATALSDSLSRSGKGAMQANLSVGGNRLTNVGAGTARSDASAISQIQDGVFVWLTNVGGTANAITAQATPTITAYVAGQTWNFQAISTNSEAVTLNVDGVGAVAVKALNGDDLQPNTIVGGGVYTVASDGSSFVLLGSSESFTTGFTVFSFDVIPRSGWLLMDGRTMALTGPADLIGTTYEALYKHLWNAVGNNGFPIAGGRGVSAQADWDANKVGTMPDGRGRSPIGAGDAPSLTNRITGETLGEEKHTQTEAELAPHFHTTNVGSGDPNAGGGAIAQVTGAIALVSDTKGSGDPFNVVHPVLAIYWFIKL